MKDHQEHQNGTPAATTRHHYSPVEIAAYHAELDELLDRIETGASHYDVLGIDELATTGEVKLAYTRVAALLHPSFYELDLPQPETALSRIDEAFEKISAAYAVLVNFNRRSEYDDSLFQRQDITPVPASIAAVPAEAATKTDSQAKAAERRVAQRFQLALPVRVSGHSREGGKWNEMTDTFDVSVSGALVRLVMPVRVGMILNVSMPMPTTLRNHAFFEADYEVYAIVRRVLPSGEEASLIGLEFLSGDPPAAYFEERWGIFNTETVSGRERRAAARVRDARTVTVEYFDVALNVVALETATTEDISKTGIRVCVKNIPDKFALVKVTGKQGALESFATVTGRYVGDDGVERLCLKFVDA